MGTIQERFIGNFKIIYIFYVPSLSPYFILCMFPFRFFLPSPILPPFIISYSLFTFLLSSLFHFFFLLSAVNSFLIILLFLFHPTIIDISICLSLLHFPRLFKKNHWDDQDVDGWLTLR
jgi:hypothetical protein